MKLPNFRLFDTQALFAALLGVSAMMMIAAEAVLVFRQYDSKSAVIWYPAKPKGIQKYRLPLIYATGAAAVVLGGIGLALGFNSLGEKRNTRQRLSWLGLATGGFGVVGACILLFAWWNLSLEAIGS